MNSINVYIYYFGALNTARIAGKNAPHKAVLLLAIMDLVEAGVIDSPRIVLTERLEEAFIHIWKRYIGTSLVFQPRVATPFWHMQNEPFYRLYTNEGRLINGGTGAHLQTSVGAYPKSLHSLNMKKGRSETPLS